MSGDYWLFAGSKYYPYGGLEDLQGRYSTFDEAMEAAAPWALKENSWWEVAQFDGSQFIVVNAHASKDYENDLVVDRRDDEGDA